MKIFFAVLGKTEPSYILGAGHKHLLCSYHYFKKEKEVIQQLKKDGAELFVDSGGFSAANVGAHIDINAYSKFLVENRIDVYVSLDVIGNPEKSFENWEYQNTEFGLQCVPTFHMNEDLCWLQKYLDAGCRYIALGGMVGSDNVDGWLTKVFKYILQQDTAIKIHGFGMTTADLIMKYPWYSFDSSSFKSGRRFGRIPQFSGKNLFNISEDKFRYDLWKTPELKEHWENIYHYKKDEWYNTMSIEGANAYQKLVDYLNQFDKRNEFTNQLELF